MPRNKLIPDDDVFAAVRRLLTEGGDKAVAFGSVARTTGLAAPTLAQRFGTRDGMVRAAMMAAWDALDGATEAAEAGAELAPKGALAILKALAGHMGPELLAADFRDAELRARAAGWRARLEAALALRLGGGKKGREAAALLFAIWQGQSLWDQAGGKGVRLKDALKRLG